MLLLGHLETAAELGARLTKSPALCSHLSSFFESSGGPEPRLRRHCHYLIIFTMGLTWNTIITCSVFDKSLCNKHLIYKRTCLVWFIQSFKSNYLPVKDNKVLSFSVAQTWMDLHIHYSQEQTIIWDALLVKTNLPVTCLSFYWLW